MPCVHAWAQRRPVRSVCVHIWQSRGRDAHSLHPPGGDGAGRAFRVGAAPPLGAHAAAALLGSGVHHDVCPFGVWHLPTNRVMPCPVARARVQRHR